MRIPTRRRGPWPLIPVACLAWIGSCTPAGPAQPADLAYDLVLAPAPASRPADAAEDATPRFTLATYPRVDGSTSAHPLGVMVGCTLMGLPTQWAQVPDGTRRILPVRPNTDELRAAVERLKHTGTHEAYVNLIEGRCDLVLVARKPSADEQKLCRERGVRLEVSPVALDAFVFLANRENAVAGLTLDQVRGIYTGRIRNWKAVGGRDEEIHPFTRDRNSGSEELMDELVMHGRPTVPGPGMMLTSMGMPIARVGDDRKGIGYSVYFYEQFMADSRGLKLLAIEGVAPTAATLRTRRYPLTTEVYAALRADAPPDAGARRVRGWLLTAEGQKVVGSTGYVPAR